MKNEKAAKEKAEQRLIMIAPLLDPGLDKEEFYQKRLEISYDFSVSTRTLQRYIDAYNEAGIDGLKPKGKVPEHNPVVSKEILEDAIRLRREVPSRSVPTIIQILELEKKIEPGSLKRTTLQRALAAAGYSTKMMKMYQDKGYASQRFQRVHRNDLWQGDIKYGPVLKLEGKPVQTYMSSLIDDATRYIIHAEFYPNMEQAIVEGVRIVTKSAKPSAKNPQGGFIKMEAPIHISNISLIDPKSGKPTRISIKKTDDGKKVRIAKKSGEEIK